MSEGSGNLGKLRNEANELGGVAITGDSGRLRNEANDLGSGLESRNWAAWRTFRSLVW